MFAVSFLITSRDALVRGAITIPRKVRAQNTYTYKNKPLVKHSSRLAWLKMHVSPREHAHPRR
ncbi:hypothetical protein R69608_05873 [Paraburkholderia nemoris]|nr:hypothetical protein R69608_05873 [Paraburkholderia nemoris]